MILLFQFNFSDIRIQFFSKKSTKSMSCYMIENFSTILTKKFVVFNRCIVTSLNNINFENFDVLKTMNIIDMIVLTIDNVENVAINNSILLLSTTKTLSIEIVVTIAYVVTHTINFFLNQSFLCVNFDFLIVNDLIFSICFEFI